MDARLHGLGTLGGLPDELLDHILRGLDSRALALLSLTSKVLHIYCTEEPLWLELHLARCKQPFEYRGSWRATYLACNPACHWPGCTAKDLRTPFQVPGFSSLFLYRRWYRGNVELSAFLPPQEAIQRIEAGALSPAEFEERFDGASQPVMLRGLAEGWEVGEWTPERLVSRLGSRLFKVTKPSGGRMKMALSSYLGYCRVQHDEEPVYIFDPDFGETAPELLSAYSVPSAFRWDLFSWAGYARDEFRWLVAGPPRSGASWHVDPAATSAWNTSLVGRKRWALYPPGKVPPGVMVHVHASGEPDFRGPTSLQWFLEVYPHLPPEHRPLEVIQNPGETVFLPSGWWHCVLNLDMTVAVTQNFVSPANLEAVVAFLALGAGTLFDDSLVPAFLAQRQQAQQEADEHIAPLGQEQQEEGGASRAAEPHAANDTAAVAGAASGRTSPHGGFSNSLSGNSSSDTDEGTHAGMPRDAAAHLREAVLGFDRGGVLGRWLRAMWVGEPSLRPRLAELAVRYTDLADWRRRLERVCEAAGKRGGGPLFTCGAYFDYEALAVLRFGLPAPQPVETFPLASGEAVVFEVAGYIIKIFNTAFYPPGLATWQMEAAAYRSMNSAAQQVQHDPSISITNGIRQVGGGDTLALLRYGALWDRCQGLLAGAVINGEPQGEQDTACSAGKAGVNTLQQQALQQGQVSGGGEGGRIGGSSSSSHCWLPYLVVRKAAGVTLGSLQPQLGLQEWQQVAAGTGRALADFHALPLPQQSCQHNVVGGVTNGEQQEVACGCGAAGHSGHNAASAACTAWVSHRGTAWSSVHGRIDKSAWARAAEGAAAAAAAGADGRLGGTQPGAASDQRVDCHEEVLKLSSMPLDLPAELQLFPDVRLEPATRAHQNDATGKGSSAADHGSKHVRGGRAVPNGAEQCVPAEPAAKRARLLQPEGGATGARQQQQQRLPQPTASPVAAPAEPRLLGGEDPAPEAAAGGPGAGVAAAWQPFLAFLEHRRQRALRPHAWEGLLPPHLAEQVEGYLPKDVSQLLGFSPATAGSCCPLPAWVHGDLTAENILLQGLPAPSREVAAVQTCQGGERTSPPAACEAAAAASSGGCKAVLIDFADGGQGDPLWDLPPLLLRSFRCNSDALAACLTAYRQRQQELEASSSSSSSRGGASGASTCAMLAMLGCRQSNHYQQQQHAGQGPLQLTPSVSSSGVGKPSLGESSSNGKGVPMRLSYVATCYTLLHELDLVEAALKRRPELWEAASLEEVQQQLWGVLDEYQ
ncbi:hypothetical protein N2152v2_004141 [Parachlorella kessleri]